MLYNCSEKHQATPAAAAACSAARMAAQILVKRCACCRNSSSPSALSISPRRSCGGALSNRSSQGTLHEELKDLQVSEGRM